MSKRSYLTYYYVHHFVEESNYRDFLGEYDKRRRDRRMRRCAMLPYKFSSFRHLYLSGNDQALLIATGYDHKTFFKLLQKFKPFYDMWMFEEENVCIHRKK